MEKSYYRLKGALVTKGVKVKDVADLLDITPSTASKKLNRINGADFKASELFKICEMCNLSADSIFFCN